MIRLFYVIVSEAARLGSFEGVQKVRGTENIE